MLISNIPFFIILFCSFNKFLILFLFFLNYILLIIFYLIRKFEMMLKLSIVGLAIARMGSRLWKD